MRKMECDVLTNISQFMQCPSASETQERDLASLAVLFALTGPRTRFWGRSSPCHWMSNHFTLLCSRSFSSCWSLFIQCSAYKIHLIIYKPICRKLPSFTLPPLSKLPRATVRSVLPRHRSLERKSLTAWAILGSDHNYVFDDMLGKDSTPGFR